MTFNLNSGQVTITQKGGASVVNDFDAFKINPNANDCGIMVDHGGSGQGANEIDVTFKAGSYGLVRIDLFNIVYVYEDT